MVMGQRMVRKQRTRVMRWHDKAILCVLGIELCLLYTAHTNCFLSSEVRSGSTYYPLSSYLIFRGSRVYGTRILLLPAQYTSRVGTRSHLNLVARAGNAWYCYIHTYLQIDRSDMYLDVTDVGLVRSVSFRFAASPQLASK